jgi:sialidase-1
MTVNSVHGPSGWPTNGHWLGDPDEGARRRNVAERVLVLEGTADGRVLMVMRSQFWSLFMAGSEDGGITWSKPQASGLSIPESCLEPARIPSTGDLVALLNNAPYDPAFDHYGKRTPLSAAVSHDGGRTWGLPRDIESDPRRAFSNPGCRFLRGALFNSTTFSAEPNVQT